MTHFVQTRSNQTRQSNDIDFVLFGLGQDCITINHNPDVVNFEVVASQDNADDVLSNIVNITSNGGQDWFVAAEGYDALGRARPTPASTHPDPEIEAAVSAAEANWAQEKQEAAKQLIKVGVEGKPRTRDNSKQATVIQMLQRPEGATIQQIMDATGWQAHTVRGTFAGAFKKKLGLNLASEKVEGNDRVYRIA